MKDIVVWVAQHWLEVSSFIVTCAALFYAHLAYRTSQQGLDQAKLAELNNLRLQTKAAMSDARQALVSLELRCHVYRAEWDRRELKKPVFLRMPKGLSDRTPIDEVLIQGRQLLGRLATSSKNLDDMDFQELEALIQSARETSLNVQALAGELKPLA